MGQFTTQVKLINVGDAIKARDGIIKAEDVRQVILDILPDTGASTLFITEETREKLGLIFEGDYVASIANGSRQRCKQTEPVAIRWKDRYAVCSAIVMEGAKHNLLGAIPLEGLDLIVDPVRQELRGAHGKAPLLLAL